LSPILPGYTFSPLIQNISVDNVNVSNIYFYLSIRIFTISGYIKNDKGAACENTEVFATGLKNQSVYSDSKGLYTFRISKGQYTIAVSNNNYNLTPAYSNVIVSSKDISNVNFTHITASYNNYNSSNYYCLINMVFIIKKWNFK